MNNLNDKNINELMKIFSNMNKNELEKNLSNVSKILNSPDADKLISEIKKKTFKE